MSNLCKTSLEGPGTRMTCEAICQVGWQPARQHVASYRRPIKDEKSSLNKNWKLLQPEFLKPRRSQVLLVYCERALTA